MAQGQYPKIFIPTDQHIWDNDFDIESPKFLGKSSDMVYLLKDKVMDIINHTLEENEELGNRDVVRDLRCIINEINNL